MSVKEETVSQEVSAATLVKPTTTVAQTVSTEFVKISHLSEYCRMAEKYLKECKDKIEMLTYAKNERLKLKTEYLTRNKINLTNCESLLQAKNELNKYKCQLKSDYIETEKTLKFRRLKYKKIISSYEYDWQRTLAQYSANPLVAQLLQLQEENALLEKEVEKIENLTNTTKIQFEELEKNVKKKFSDKVVEFSEWMLYHIDLQKKRSKRNSVESQNIFGNSFKLNIDAIKFSSRNLENLWCADANEEPSSLSVDVSLFDSLSIPTENLEVENEEDIIPFIQNTECRFQAGEKETGEKKCPEPDDQLRRSSGRSEDEASMSEKESRYFRASEQTGNPWQSTAGNCEKEFNENLGASSKLNAEELRSDEGEPRGEAAKETFGMENDESSSYGSPRSDENSFFWRSHDEEEDNTPFAGFFTGDSTSSKPSFFKLF